MDALEAIATRRTIGRLVEPAPDEAALDKAFAAAICAPDHKRLRPWRFLVVSGAARQAFGALLAQSLRRRKPDASDDDLAREAGKALRAPMIVVSIARVRADAGIPEIEQMLAAGAATQNLMLALHAQGYGTAWKTGAASYDPAVGAALGLAADERIVGFVYMGSVAAQPPAAPPADPRAFVSTWTAAR